MHNIFSDNILWSIGAIITLFGIIAVHRLVLYRDKRNDFNKAAKEFYDIINNELKDIYPKPVNWPDNVDKYFKEKFPTLQSAVDKFAGHLPGKEKANFLKAWQFYCLGKEGRDVDLQYYGQYRSGESTTRIDGKEVTEITDGKANLKCNVDSLLSYANQR
jgi:hypothetical protein